MIKSSKKGILNARQVFKMRHYVKVIITDLRACVLKASMCTKGEHDIGGAGFFSLEKQRLGELIAVFSYLQGVVDKSQTSQCLTLKG